MAHFCHPGSGSEFQIRIRIRIPNTDPDPANKNQCGFGSEALDLTRYTSSQDEVERADPAGRQEDGPEGVLHYLRHWQWGMMTEHARSLNLKF